MKKAILVVAALLVAGVMAPQGWAYEACTSITSSAGGTNLVPQGVKRSLTITLTGSASMYCRCNPPSTGVGSSGGGGGAPTATAFDIYLNGVGAQWFSPLNSETDVPPGKLGASRAWGCKIDCLSSSGSQTACYVTE